MTPTPVATGSIAFVGPAQVPTLSEFRYVRVTSVDGDNAKVALVSIDDDGDEAIEDEVGVTILQRRRVSADESELWPGTFVGHPVAFIQPDGAALDEWAFGVVTGYRMVGSQPYLHLRGSDGALKIKLESPFNVVKVDWVSYALQIGGGTNASATNAEELVALMDEILELFTKARTALPAKVSKLLSVPFDGDAFVPVIRPDTLAVTEVPRQHLLECARNRKGKKGVSMFEAPGVSAGQASTASKRKATTAPQDSERPARRRKTADGGPTNAEAAEALISEFTLPDAEEDEDEADIRTVQLQNRALGSDGGAAAAIPQAGIFSHSGIPVGEDARGRAATTFRPSTLEQQIHNAIGHPEHQGKDAQCILECAQARETRFRGSPPVLRGAYDFGFHVRGLSVMHFARVPRISTLDTTATTLNMTDFSRKNSLPPVTTEPSYSGLLDSLTNLRQFGRGFYNEETAGVVKAAFEFLENFADGGEPDQDTTKRLALWINMKFGKFRGLVISGGIAVAARVIEEFSLQDSLLSELLYDLQKAKLDALKTLIESKPVGTTAPHTSLREQRQIRPGGLSANVARTLPKQGSQQLCLKHLSKAGCTGNGTPGKCFAKSRAHFRPKFLSAEAKDHIDKHFGGLSSEFADL